MYLLKKSPNNESSEGREFAKEKERERERERERGKEIANVANH